MNLYLSKNINNEIIQIQNERTEGRWLKFVKSIDEYNGFLEKQRTFRNKYLPFLEFKYKTKLLL